MSENLIKIWKVLETGWQAITGFFGGIANAFINNPEVAIPITIGIIIVIILSVLGIIKKP